MPNCPTCNRPIYEAKYCYFCGRVFSTVEQKQLERKLWLEQKQLEEEVLNDIFGKKIKLEPYNPWKYKVCALILGIVLAFDTILITVYKKTANILRSTQPYNTILSIRYLLNSVNNYRLDWLLFHDN